MSDQPEVLAEPDSAAEDASEEAAEEAAEGSPDDAEPEGAAATRGKRKRRRKRRKRADDEPPARDELDENGRERPRFLLDFPHDPGLERLIAAFESGNYAKVRELAPNLIEHADSVAVREAALEIRRRIEPDPLLKYLLLASALLLAVLVWYAYANHGAHAH